MWNKVTCISINLIISRSKATEMSETQQLISKVIYNFFYRMEMMTKHLTLEVLRGWESGREVRVQRESRCTIAQGYLLDTKASISVLPYKQDCTFLIKRICGKMASVFNYASSNLKINQVTVVVLHYLQNA